MSEFPSKRVAAYKGFKWPSRRYHFESNTVLTSLTVTEYLCHRWPRIYSVCRSNNPVFSLLMKCHLRLNNINTTGNTSGAEATYYSGSHEFTFGFFWVCIMWLNFYFCVVFCRPMFVFFTFCLFHFLSFPLFIFCLCVDLRLFLTP